jgi:hypothetical protein
MPVHRHGVFFNIGLKKKHEKYTTAVGVPAQKKIPRWTGIRCIYSLRCILGRGSHNWIYFNCYLHSRILHPKVELTQKFRGALKSPKNESHIKRTGEILFFRLQRFLLYVVDEYLKRNF